ncbi:Nif3-like dinuclear metal center hexameric protein [Desulfitobacterium sp.]|uniref:Nif3-like dinuclear metal center hexameric protein n=1 Tax=Desulfitobacterium sp. TaxID=49981 RepID=UPI002C3194A4|nr:Nif3-like dinuclear metal center hexameric protein [Desulfitobacterium sp.]HVJ47598.1 Nif3-like dinuclear metal center hexameric protein [Desulfitobacterium sp.]
MSVSIGLIGQTVEKIAPKSWAEEWDNVGLLVGDASTQVERILLTLDATQEVLEEAKERKAQLILAHHPIIFRPLKNLRSDNQAAQIPIQLLKEGIAYYAAHTNLDQSMYSSSWTIGRALGLDNMEFLAPHASEDRGYGVVGYLPVPEPLESIVDKLKMFFHTQASVHVDIPSNLYRIARKTQLEIRKIAILNGSGGSFITKALFKGADLLVTGDVDHHGALDAREAGMAVLDIGHFASEAPMIMTLADYLRGQKNLAHLEILVSSTMQSPWE